MVLLYTEFLKNFSGIFGLCAGIMFWDVTTLLLDHKAFKDTIDILVERYRDQKVDVIVGKVLQKNEIVLECGEFVI